MSRRFLSGGVSQCFHCLKQLVRKPGGFIFDLIHDPDDNPVRVHKACVQASLGHGYTKEKKS